MTTKPSNNELNILFRKDRNGCVIVVFYEAHGSLVQEVRQAGLPTKVGGKDAIRLTGKVGQTVKKLGLERTSFIANGHTYHSYRPATAIA